MEKMYRPQLPFRLDFNIGEIDFQSLGGRGRFTKLALTRSAVWVTQNRNNFTEGLDHVL